MREVEEVVLAGARHKVPDGVRQLVFRLNETVLAFFVIMVSDVKRRGAQRECLTDLLRHFKVSIPLLISF